MRTWTIVRAQRAVVVVRRPLKLDVMRRVSAQLPLLLAAASVASTADALANSPTPAEILAEVQAAVRSKTSDSAKAACHPRYAFAADAWESKLFTRFLSMTPSNLRDFKYFPTDGVAEAFLLGEHPRIFIHLWVATKDGACDEFEFFEIVS